MSRNLTKVLGGFVLAAVAITAMITGHMEIMTGLGLLAFFLLII